MNLRRRGTPTWTVGLVLEDVANPYQAQLHRQIEDAVRERGPLVLAASTDEDPRRNDAWGYEVKWDGVRTIARVRDGRLRLTSRSLRDVTGTYPEIGRLGDALDGRQVILDGELVMLDDRAGSRASPSSSTALGC